MKLIVLLYVAATTLFLAGCVSIHVKLPDGKEIHYNRFLSDQQLNGVLMEKDGSFVIEQQKSTMEGAYEVLGKLVDRIPVP
jgi:hypothetical protein